MDTTFLQEHMGNILIAVFVAWVCWKRLIAPKLSGVKKISASEYIEFRHNPHTLLDVRSSGEWQSGHAPGAMHIPLGDIANRAGEVPGMKPLVVICASGNRSAMAATTLATYGIPVVYNFSGGMGAWKKAGLPVQSGS